MAHKHLSANGLADTGRGGDDTVAIFFVDFENPTLNLIEKFERVLPMGES
jgi:hypothetical protein